ncbi:MAG TPA: hypothetical protein VEK08_01170 [Planctomycetota bacterium]|nr:hypothetical protein [Planctomycetota bacterium]
MRTLLTITFILFTLAAAPLLAGQKGESQIEKEAARAAEEDAAAAARKSDQLYEISMRGKLQIDAEKKADPKALVLGTFAAEGRLFEVKADSPLVRQDLEKNDGRELTLEGKIRNDGKYFIVQNVPSPPPPPVKLRNRKGI